MFPATAVFKVKASCALHAGRERVPGYNWEINHVNTSPYFDSCHRHDEPDLGKICSHQLNRLRITRRRRRDSAERSVLQRQWIKEVLPCGNAPTL